MAMYHDTETGKLFVTLTNITFGVNNVKHFVISASLETSYANIARDFAFQLAREHDLDLIAPVNPA